MTLAPRVQVFTQLSCNQLYHHESHTLPLVYSHPNIYADTASSYHLLSFDALTPTGNTCSSDPAVQSRAARLQTIMMTTMGIMSALTTGWWGHFGERHGRTRVLAASTFGLLLTSVPTPHLISLADSPVVTLHSIYYQPQTILGNDMLRSSSSLPPSLRVYLAGGQPFKQRLQRTYRTVLPMVLVPKYSLA